MNKNNVQQVGVKYCVYMEESYHSFFYPVLFGNKDFWTPQKYGAGSLILPEW